MYPIRSRVLQGASHVVTDPTTATVAAAATLTLSGGYLMSKKALFLVPLLLTAIGVTLMYQATQQNAALVEEATAAAQSLQHQAVALAEAVAGFKLDNGTAGSWGSSAAPQRGQALALSQD